MQSESIIRDGIRLNVVKGEGHTPVFFQHGLCGSAVQTTEAFPNDLRFGLRTLECRGHGTSESGPLQSFSIRDFASDVAAFIEIEHSSPVVVGGISMGAAIALHLAVHRPELVKALVIARPAWCCEPSPENMRPNLEVGELMQDFAPHVAQEKFANSETAKHLAKFAPDNLASLNSFFSREPTEVTSALLRFISRDGPGVTREQVQVLRIPTLIIGTEQDHIHPLVHATTLKDLITHARLAVITPKGVDKSRYVAAFRSEFLRFLEDHA